MVLETSDQNHHDRQTGQQWTLEFDDSLRFADDVLVAIRKDNSIAAQS